MSMKGIILSMYVWVLFLVVLVWTMFSRCVILCRVVVDFFMIFGRLLFVWWLMRIVVSVFEIVGLLMWVDMFRMVWSSGVLSFISLSARSSFLFIGGCMSFALLVMVLLSDGVVFSAFDSKSSYELSCFSSCCICLVVLFLRM